MLVNNEIVDNEDDEQDLDRSKSWLPKWESIPSITAMQRDYKDAKPFN